MLNRRRKAAVRAYHTLNETVVKGKTQSQWGVVKRLCLESAHQADANRQHRETGRPGAKNKVHPPHYRTRVTISQANARQHQKNTDTHQRAAGRNEKKAEELPNELKRIR